MSTIGPALPPSSITPTYSPLGKPAVGLETPEAKSQTLPPVEQSTRPDKHRSPPDSDPVATDADRRKRREHGAQSHDADDDESSGVRESAVADREVRAHEVANGTIGGSQAGSAGFRFITGSTPAGAEKSIGSADAANAFKTAEPDSAPGSLLDQLI